MKNSFPAKLQTGIITLSAVGASLLIIGSARPGTARAHHGGDSDCQEQTWTYTKSSDFSDEKIIIDFENGDRQIDVTAKSGYQITEVALDVEDDGHPGFHVYANGPLNNFDPNPGKDIDGAKVKVKNICAGGSSGSTGSTGSTGSSGSSGATGSTGSNGNDKILWCHVEPNGNSQTLELPEAALREAGHMDAEGNPLHAGDHAGACETGGSGASGASGASGTSGATGSTGQEPTITPTPTTVSQNNPGGSGGDGKSDGKSDGRSSCPECTQAPTGNVLGASVGGGQVLGASTDGFAPTGSADGVLTNLMGAVGAIFTAVGAFFAKKTTR